MGILGLKFNHLFSVISVVFTAIAMRFPNTKILALTDTQTYLLDPNLLIDLEKLKVNSRVPKIYPFRPN